MLRSLLTAPRSRAVRAFAWLLVCMLLLSALQRLIPLLGSDRRLLLQYYTEDAFYLHTVARNLALGHGITIDGIHPTNGFQPLSLFLYAPFYLISGGERLLALRLAYALEFGMAVCTAAGVYFILRRLHRQNPWIPLVGAVLWFAPVRVIRNDMNGLETGLYLLMLVWTTFAYLRFRERSERRLNDALLIGALLGITFLSRNDGAFFGVSMALGHIGLEANRRRAFGEVLLMGAVATVIGLPWLVFNRLRFGSIVPQSGHAESLGAAFGDNIGGVLRYFASYLGVTGQLPSSVFGSPAATALALALNLVCIGALLHWSIRKGNGIDRVLGFVWAPYALLLTCFYGLFFGAPSFVFRFLCPVWLFVTLMASAPLGTLFESLSEKGKLVRAFIGAACVCLLTIANYARDTHGVFTNPWFRPVVQFTDWAKANVGPGEVIASNQTGMLGYFIDNVVNLDGKTNVDALRARERGELQKYFCELNPDYFIEWTPIAEAWFATPEVRNQYRIVARKKGRFDYMVLGRRAPDP